MLEKKIVTHTVTETAVFAVCDRCGKVSDEKIKNGYFGGTMEGFNRIAVGEEDNFYEALVCDDCLNEIKTAIEATGCKLHRSELSSKSKE